MTPRTVQSLCVKWLKLYLPGGLTAQLNDTRKIDSVFPKILEHLLVCIFYVTVSSY